MREELTETKSLVLIILLLGALALIAILSLPTSLLRLLTTVLLICLLPGWALVEALFVGAKDKRPVLVERLLLGLGTGYVITIVGGLWLYYLFGQLTLSILLIFYLAVILIGLGWILVRSGSSVASEFANPNNAATKKSTPLGILAQITRFSLVRPKLGLDKIDSWWLLGLLVITAYFRFYFLSYSDFRGDEAEVILRAISVIRGQGEPLLSHTKGPAEVLLTASQGLLYGAFEELAVRIPFALSNFLTVAAVYFLGKSMFGRRTAVLATALVAINGWFVAFGRTVQYQNLILLTTVFSVWSFWRFYQKGMYQDLFLGIFFLAAATLSHYDGAAVILATGFLLILGLRRRKDWQTLQALRSLSGLLILGAVIGLSFYLPFLFSSTIADTGHYLSSHIGEMPPHNNWGQFYFNSLLNNSTYYFYSVGLILLLGLLSGVWYISGDGRLGVVTAGISLLILGLTWRGGLPAWSTLILILAIVIILVLSAKIQVPTKTLLLWFILPFCVYLFFVDRPRDHYYVFMPPLMLLAAFILDRGLHRLNQWVAHRWLMPATVGLLLLLYGLSGWYEYLVFIRTDLEYILTYPEYRQPVFTSDPRFPFGIRIGWGFPYRLGWQTISQLYREGQLAGDWYGTDENNSIFLYTLGWPRNPCFPRYFMITDIGYRDPPLVVPMDTIERYYRLQAIVEVNGRSRLRLYEFAPEGRDVQPATYTEPTKNILLLRQEQFIGNPLEGPILTPSILLNPSRQFKPHPNMLAKLVDVYDDPNTVHFPDRASLLGYDLDKTWVKPGGLLVLTLYWHADSRMFLPYKVFVHLEDTRVWAQADDEPGCAQLPTYNWEADDVIMDRHVIFLPDDIPPGDYPIKVGMYELRSGLRMDLLDEMGNPVGNALELTSVTIPPLE